MADTFHMVNVDVGTSDGTVLTAGGSETFVIIGCELYAQQIPAPAYEVVLFDSATFVMIGLELSQ